MGVKDLWPVLGQACTLVDISSLQDKRLAVDLSGWIFESFGVPDLASKISKPHLRTLFYRCRQLLKYGIKPVFVLEGSPPLPKKGRKPGDASPAKTGSPKKNTCSQQTRECCDLLDSLGIPYVQAPGEAEATCAALNEAGVVDGVITNDGDAFLFGAQTVYRNFTGNEKDTEIKCYTSSGIQAECGLDRRKLIAYALLVGCDYTDGVYSVGRDQTARLLQTFSDQDPLDRLRSWKGNEQLDEIEGYKQLRKPTHCGQCGHLGAKTSHTSSGCATCKTSVACAEELQACSCDWHVKHKAYEQHKLELSVREKAAKLNQFPPEEIIKEFLEPCCYVPNEALEWKRPDMIKVKELLTRLLSWSLQETSERMLPVLTTWDLLHQQQGCDMLSLPHGILRARVHQFTPVYEVEWESVEGICIHDLSEPKMVTLEEKGLFARCFPPMAKKFDDDFKKTKDTPKKWKRKGRSLDEIEEVRKITDIWPLKKKTYLKRTDIIASAKEGEEPTFSARKRLVFHGDTPPGTPKPATRSSPRKLQRSLRDGDSTSPSGIKRKSLFQSETAAKKRQVGSTSGASAAKGSASILSMLQKPPNVQRKVLGATGRPMTEKSVIEIADSDDSCAASSDLLPDLA